MKKFEDCTCICHRMQGVRHDQPCCDQTYKQRDEEPPTEITTESLAEYLKEIFFTHVPEPDGTSHNKWVKWLQENGGPVKDLGGGAYQIGPEGPITGKGGVEMFRKYLAEEASAFTTKDPDKTEEE